MAVVFCDGGARLWSAVPSDAASAIGLASARPSLQEMPNAQNSKRGRKICEPPKKANHWAKLNHHFLGISPSLAATQSGFRHAPTIHSRCSPFDSMDCVSARPSRDLAFAAMDGRGSRALNKTPGAYWLDCTLRSCSEFRAAALHFGIRARQDGLWNRRAKSGRWVSLD